MRWLNHQSEPWCNDNDIISAREKMIRDRQVHFFRILESSDVRCTTIIMMEYLTGVGPGCGMRVTYYYSFTKFLGTILLRDLSPAKIYAWAWAWSHRHKEKYISKNISWYFEMICMTKHRRDKHFVGIARVFWFSWMLYLNKSKSSILARYKCAENPTLLKLYPENRLSTW